MDPANASIYVCGESESTATASVQFAEALDFLDGESIKILAPSIHDYDFLDNDLFRSTYTSGVDTLPLQLDAMSALQFIESEKIALTGTAPKATEYAYLSSTDQLGQLASASVQCTPIHDGLAGNCAVFVSRLDPAAKGHVQNTPEPLSTSKCSLRKRQTAYRRNVLSLRDKRNSNSSLIDRNLCFDYPDQISCKRQKLEQNRVSARACRRRKRERIQGIEGRCRFLEQENVLLRSKIRAGKEERKRQMEQKRQFCADLECMINSEDFETKIASKVALFQKLFSDAGQYRREKIKQHLEIVKNLLLPTSIMKVSTWAICLDHHNDDDASSTMAQILIKELQLSHQQRKRIDKSRDSLRAICYQFEKAMSILKSLESRIQIKDSILEFHMRNLEAVLTPSQHAKLIVWVSKNPACVHFISKLWQSSQ